MAPILLTGLTIGLVVGAIQAATQVNEPTLTFVPKIIGVGLVCAWLMPWGLDRYAGLLRAVAISMVEVSTR
ncbi:MAG: flagellar biosynthetic protein FliQ [Myxococcales bacterium]|nr:flagellar biosynthetic protein FliQ [Myxococcales bacterium]